MARGTGEGSAAQRVGRRFAARLGVECGHDYEPEWDYDVIDVPAETADLVGGLVATSPRSPACESA